MKKKYYVHPCVTAEKMDATELICASLDIISVVGINYGGIDEEGTVIVESRRYSVWSDDEDSWN